MKHQIKMEELILELNQQTTGRSTWHQKKLWSSHRNKNSTSAINFRVSQQVEEHSCIRFHMGGWEFFTEASRNNQAFRTTLVEGEGHVKSLY